MDPVYVLNASLILIAVALFMINSNLKKIFEKMDERSRKMREENDRQNREQDNDEEEKLRRAIENLSKKQNP
jgi:large-conductance mechanosensitive channel